MCSLYGFLCDIFIQAYDTLSILSSVIFSDHLLLEPSVSLIAQFREGCFKMSLIGMLILSHSRKDPLSVPKFGQPEKQRPDLY